MYLKKNHPVESALTGKGETVEQLFSKYNISNREQEIIHLICQGKTNKEIEDVLFISLQTVKHHIYNIYNKMGIKNRVQLTNMVRGAAAEGGKGSD
jgi:DNA-binding NarL/FixJ family response regulator